MPENIPQNPKVKTSEYKYFKGHRDQDAIDFLTDQQFGENDFADNNPPLNLLLERNKKLQ